MRKRRRASLYRLDATPTTTHTGFFDSTTLPVLTIEAGDTVIFRTQMLMDDKLRCGINIEELMALRRSYIDQKIGLHTLTGPIFVNGAEPGDALEVRIKELVPRPCGVNYNLGRIQNYDIFKSEEVPNEQVTTVQFDLKEMKANSFPGTMISLKPFLGTMGVAPKYGERKPAAIPGYFGGNIDNKELTAGSTLYLPVNVKGALFSTGDAHAAQGDGEINGTAIETAMEKAVLQFVVTKNLNLLRPIAETPTHWITMGFHENLDEAAKIASRDAIQFIETNIKLPLAKAYALASIAVDLRITQIVNGNKGVHAMIPKSLFKKNLRVGKPVPGIDTLQHA